MHLHPLNKPDFCCSLSHALIPPNFLFMLLLCSDDHLFVLQNIIYKTPARSHWHI